MAITNKKLTVTGDAAAVIVAGDPAGNNYLTENHVEINNTSANSVWVGGPGVTDGTSAGGTAATAGRTIPTNTSFSVDLKPGDTLYIFAHVTSVVEVFATGQ